MSARSSTVALRVPDSPAVSLSAREAAERLGVTVRQLEALARTWYLEPTYSVVEVAAHFGCGKAQIFGLVKYGLHYGQALHPFRGGLWPTFKPSHKSRRIPLSAIERHKAHMARVHDAAA